MNKKQLLALVLPVLLSTSGPAVAKGGAQALSGTTSKDGAALASQQATSPAANKAENRSAKGNATPGTGGAASGGTQDPFSVPLFKDAKPLR